jgi:hypothetical protein
VPESTSLGDDGHGPLLHRSGKRRVRSQGGSRQALRTSQSSLEYAAFTSMDAAPAVEIVWTQAQGGDECIGQDDLATKVQAAIGRTSQTLLPDGRPDLAIVRGSIGKDPSGQGWAAAIEVRRGDGPPLRRELRLSAANCRQLDETIVLVVEMLLDAAILQEKPPSVVENSRPKLAVSLGPDVAIGIGMLPGISFGLGLVSETEIHPLWPIAVWGHFWSPTIMTAAALPGQWEAWTFGAAACRLTFPGNVLTLFGCVGGSGGWINSHGVASLGVLNSTNDALRTYVEIDARVGVRLRIVGPIVARLALGAGVPVSLYSYEYYDARGVPSRPVFTTWPVGATIELGIELRAQ